MAGRQPNGFHALKASVIVLNLVSVVFVGRLVANNCTIMFCVFCPLLSKSACQES